MKYTVLKAVNDPIGPGFNNTGSKFQTNAMFDLSRKLNWADTIQPSHKQLCHYISNLTHKHTYCYNHSFH